MTTPPPARRRRLLLASPRGSCAGVDRAVSTVQKALEVYGPPVYVRRQIVHNIYVVQALEREGAVFVEETREVPEGSVVVLSAHGVAPMVRSEADARSLISVDATCPLVTKIHKEALRFASEGYDIILIGHEGHDEIIGTAGQAPDRIHVVDPDDVAGIHVRDENRVAWLSQTTLSVDKTIETVAKLEMRFPGIVGPPSDDICYATQNRQLAVKRVAGESDLVIIVGSANSSNSQRLVEVSLEAGAAAAYRVDFADQIDESWLQGVSTVGVSAGASAPEILVQGVVARLADYDFKEVEEVRVTSEPQRMALPRELTHPRQPKSSSRESG